MTGIAYIYSDDILDAAEKTHIVPLRDLREHELSIHCWCEPTQDDEQETIWLHHAADGREQYEDGTRRPH